MLLPYRVTIRATSIPVLAVYGNGLSAKEWESGLATELQQQQVCYVYFSRPCAKKLNSMRL